MENWCYLVKIIMGTAYDDIQDPEFRFNLDEKDKMINFIDTCVVNGHEVNIVRQFIIKKINEN